MKMNTNKNLPIGVFDSGIGGLTVLKELIEMFPHEDFFYIGDTLNLPYGTKTNDQIAGLVTNVCTYLVEYPVKSIVIACNTATTNSHHLQDFIEIPVLGVVEPTAKHALSISENILVLATNVTIETKAYQKIIDSTKKNSNSQQFYLKCSEFVEAIEANEIGTEYSYSLVSSKLSSVKDENIEVIILGCTHFGLYANEIKNVFPKAKLVECANPTGRALYEKLKSYDLLKGGNEIGKTKICVTKKQDNFYEKTKWFNKPYEGCLEIDIIKNG